MMCINKEGWNIIIIKRITRIIINKNNYNKDKRII